MSANCTKETLGRIYYLRIRSCGLPLRGGSRPKICKMCYARCILDVSIEFMLEAACKTASFVNTIYLLRNKDISNINVSLRNKYQ